MNSNDAAEAERLAVLQQYGILDTPPDPILDGLTTLACALLDVPVSLVSLVDDRRQWFKSRQGLDVAQTARDISFCHHVVVDRDELVVEDASADPRFATNPLVTGAPHIQAYLGIPLRVPEGEILGSLCAIDHRPRPFTEAQRTHLRALTQLVTERLVQLQQQRALSAAHEELDLHRGFFVNGQDLNCIASADGRFLDLNSRWQDVLGYSLDVLKEQPFLSFIHPDDLPQTVEVMGQLTEYSALNGFRNRYRHADGSYRWLEWSAHRRSGSRIFASARDVTQLLADQQAMHEQHALMAFIADVQTSLLSSGLSRAWWTSVLDRILALTGSEYGFIGVVGRDAQGEYLHTRAITDISWDDATRRLYKEQEEAGMYFRNMRTLFGAGILGEARVIANDVARDPRAGGRPPGHPPLRTFAGLPIRDGKKMVGMVGLANRPDGYTDVLLDRLEPLLAVLGSVIKNDTLEALRWQMMSELEAAKHLQDHVFDLSSSGFVAMASDGRVAFYNRSARAILPGLASPEAQAPEGGLPAALALLFPDEADCRWVLAQTDSVSDHATPASRTMRGRGPNAESIPLDVTAARVQGHQGAAHSLVLTLSDLRPRLALETSLQQNAVLEDRVAQLRAHQQTSAVLSECIEYLQACSTLEEGLELIGRSMERLFPGANVSLYAQSDDPDTLALRRSAVRFGSQAEHDGLTRQQCWGLRSRRTHGSWPGGHHLACEHTAPTTGGEICMPLFSLDRVVALATVEYSPTDQTNTAQNIETRLAQSAAMAQGLSGALSTIALRESLQKLALVDELTDLANRRAFQRETIRTISRLRRAGRPFALAVLDLDEFKSVNDTFGHDAGDQLLKDVSYVMRRSIRDSDLVARVGGEEFALFMPDVPSDVAVRRAEGMLESIRTSCSIFGRRVTASLGLAVSGDFSADAGYDVLFSEADKALYRAKGTGRDRMVRASSGA